MNILVFVKMVPNTKHMTIDSETNRLVRHGISSILNPADRYVLEKALRFRDQYGGTVTVISMGVPQVAEILVSAYMVGVDRCVLLTDPLFGGSDSFATASILTAAVKYEEKRTGNPFDIIFCGKSTIDGETGQVGPELAELLGIPCFTDIIEMECRETVCGIKYALDEMSIRAEVRFPVLVTYPLSGDAYLRGAIPERLEQAGEIKIPQLTFEDLAPWMNEKEIGLSGSATRVVRSFVPETQRKCIRIDQGSTKEKVNQLVSYLVQDGLLGREQKEVQALSEAETVNEKDNGRMFVFVEQKQDGLCKNVSLELLTPAKQIADAAGYKVTAILTGTDNQKAEIELYQYPVDEIITCEDEMFRDMQFHSYVEAVADMVREYKPEGFLIGGTELGKILASRIAARFHTGLTAECTGIRFDQEKNGIIWSRPAYGGKLMADIICQEKRPQMGTVREGVFVKPAKCAGKPDVIQYKAVKSALEEKVTVVEKTITPGFLPKGESEISMVVGMGRGIRDMDGFDLCCDFADAVGAEIGASRGGVELRFMSQKYLIGSNGRTIRPSIYFACGISGSLQHMTGVLDSGCIVAVNSDPKAEIFQYADYGVVGDLFQVIPELQKQILRHNSGKKEK